MGQAEEIEARRCPSQKNIFDRPHVSFNLSYATTKSTLTHPTASRLNCVGSGLLAYVCKARAETVVPWSQRLGEKGLAMIHQRRRQRRKPALECNRNALAFRPASSRAEHDAGVVCAERQGESVQARFLEMAAKNQ